MLIIERSFEHYYMPEHVYYNKLHKRFDFMVDNIEGPNVIDIGCGTGLTPFLLARWPDIKFIAGIDIMQEALDEAKQNVKSDKVTFYRCEAENLPFIDNTFDTAVITETLEHVEDVDKTLFEASRVLKPDGGIIVITVPNEGKIGKNKGPWSHVRSFNKDNLMEYVNKYFKCVRVSMIENYLCYIGIIGRLLKNE